MRWEAARERVSARSMAVCGRDTSEAPDSFLMHSDSSGEEICRRMLSGVLEGEQLDEAIASLPALARNTFGLFTMGMPLDTLLASVQVLFCQQLLMGLLVAGEDDADGAAGGRRAA